MAYSLGFCAQDSEKQFFIDDVNQQRVPKLAQPKNHRAKISVWTDLSVNDVEVLSQLSSADHIRAELSVMFNLIDHQSNPRSAVLLDLYYYTIQFAHDNNFTKEQTSAFFSIVKSTHEVCVETPFGNLENCFMYFKDMVLCHAVKRAPFSIDLFNAEDVRKITEYVINTYFRHYKLYKFTFTPKVTLDLNIMYIGLPPTPEPSDVEESVKDEGEESALELHEEPATSVMEEQAPEDEASMNELRKLIRQHLSEELKKLRSSVDQQIKSTEDNISKRLVAAETATTASKPGGRDASPGRGKKK